MIVIYVMILIYQRRKTTSCDLEIGGYIYQGGHFIYAQNTDIEYKYGENGIAGFEIKTDFTEPKAYWYLKNIMGDVTAIYDNDKNLVAEYKYDAWGNCIVVDMTADKVGTLNAIRYRGYYYDVETKLYYLKSRYYDAEIGRFVNADNVTIVDVSARQINGLNLYAYCFNNCTMYFDSNGTYPISIWNSGRQNVLRGLWGIEFIVGGFNQDDLLLSNSGIILYGVEGSVAEVKLHLTDKGFHSPITLSAHGLQATAWVGTGAGVMVSAITLEIDNSYANIQLHVGAVGASVGMKDGVVTVSVALGIGASFTIDTKRIVKKIKSWFKW